MKCVCISNDKAIYYKKVLFAMLELKPMQFLDKIDTSSNVILKSKYIQLSNNAYDKPDQNKSFLYLQEQFENNSKYSPLDFMNFLMGTKI